VPPRSQSFGICLPDWLRASLSPEMAETINRLLDIIPKRLVPIVMNDGVPSRPAWQCALMLKLQEELKSGNISVGNS
jgi:hypothetical protein